jgi:hypothetical protein
VRFIQTKVKMNIFSAGPTCQGSQTVEIRWNTNEMA